MVCDILVFLFAVSQRTHLKKRYQCRPEKVKEYLDTVKDFDELVSPQSLFLHFLGPEPSSKVQRNLEVVKKNECSIFSSFSFLFLFLYIYIYIYIYIYSLSFPSGMSTRFSKQKLAEAHEKKAKGGLVSGLLSKKHSKVGDVSKDDPVVTPPFSHSLAKCLASPASSLEVIDSVGEETKKKKKVGGKPFLPSF